MSPFVAINFIECTPDYQERFEALFASRAGAIDEMPGFLRMEVLKPRESGQAYLIVSHWESEENFKAWTTSPAFLAGHKRGFADIKKAREAGQTPPMSSTFRTYHVIST